MNSAFWGGKMWLVLLIASKIHTIFCIVKTAQAQTSSNFRFTNNFYAAFMFDMCVCVCVCDVGRVVSQLCKKHSVAPLTDLMTKRSFCLFCTMCIFSFSCILTTINAHRHKRQIFTRTRRQNGGLFQVQSSNWVSDAHMRLFCECS